MKLNSPTERMPVIYAIGVACIFLLMCVLSWNTVRVHKTRLRAVKQIEVGMKIKEVDLLMGKVGGRSHETIRGRVSYIFSRPCIDTGLNVHSTDGVVTGYTLWRGSDRAEGPPYPFSSERTWLFKSLLLCSPLGLALHARVERVKAFRRGNSPQLETVVERFWEAVFLFVIVMSIA